MKNQPPISADYTDAERREMLTKMQAASDVFYRLAQATGVHAFIEFTGLMNEFIKVCEASLQAGVPFEFASTHSGRSLEFQPYHLRYLAEKLGCIFGPTLMASPINRDTFIDELLDGQGVVISRAAAEDWKKFRAAVWDAYAIESDSTDEPFAIMHTRLEGAKARIAALEAELAGYKLGSGERVAALQEEVAGYKDALKAVREVLVARGALEDPEKLAVDAVLHDRAEARKLLASGVAVNASQFTSGEYRAFCQGYDLGVERERAGVAKGVHDTSAAREDH